MAKIKSEAKGYTDADLQRNRKRKSHLESKRLNDGILAKRLRLGKHLPGIDVMEFTIKQLRTKIRKLKEVINVH